MKFRTGFVSNSSSSSFILKDKNLSLKEFKSDIRCIWSSLYEVGACQKENLSNISTFLDFKMISKKYKKQIIKKMYLDEYYGSESKINYQYISSYDTIFVKVKKLMCNLFGKTYLQEAMKADIFGTSKNNAIPYEVLEALEEKYKSNLIIHHLG